MYHELSSYNKFGKRGREAKLREVMKILNLNLIICYKVTMQNDAMLCYMCSEGARWKNN